MKKILFSIVILLLLIMISACDGTPNMTTEWVDETTAAPVSDASSDDAPSTEEPSETADPNHEHIWVPDAENSKAPTCAMPGKNALKCSVLGCDETKGERVDRLEHIPDGEATCIKDSKCTLCGKVLAQVVSHNYELLVTVPATCTAEGKGSEVCTVCGDEKAVILPITHSLVETQDPTGSYVTRVCTLCKYSETSVYFRTIVRYDFETDKKVFDYLSEAEGFKALPDRSTGTYIIEKEADSDNHYLRSSAALFVQDENLTLIKEDKYIIEYDVMLSALPNDTNKTLFSILPNYIGNDPISWIWLMKVNSWDDKKGATPGEFVTYGSCSYETLNTGYVFEPQKWYHITFVCDWVSGTTQIYVSERGGENMYVATGAYELYDAVDPAQYDGKPDGKREEIHNCLIRFCDNGVSANFDNLHIYTAEKPIWE